MAKETKSKQTNEEVTEENVMDQIRGKNLIDNEIAKIGDEKDNEAEINRKVENYRKIKNKAKYINLKSLLELRSRRREERATKKKLTETKELLTKLTNGEITPIQWSDEYEKLRRELSTAISDSDKEFRKEVQELRDAFPGYWSYEWD